MDYNKEKITPRYVCEEMAKLSAEDAKLTRRPWDRFRPDSTAWYLVPSSSVTYYKFGKLCFSKEKETSDVINCGLFFEKGLGEALGTVYSSKQAKPLIMDSSWFWHKFINQPIFPENTYKVYVEGGYVTEPNSFDPYRMRMLKWDKYILDYDGYKDAFSVAHSHRESFVLKLHNIKKLSDFILAMKQLEKDEWLWLNIFICKELKATIPELKNECKNLYEIFIKDFTKLIDQNQKI